MSDDKILPLDGGDVQDDQALKARMVRAYLNTPRSSAGAVARCVRFVLERAATEPLQPAVAFETRRKWMLGAAAIAAALLVSVTLRNRMPTDTSHADARNTEPVATTTAVAGGIQFDLLLPKGPAANVSVIGDFNGWDANATPMVRDAKSGEWSAKIALLPGRHIYAYLVNGEKWVVDPLKPQVPDAGYGPANALVVEEETK